MFKAIIVVVDNLPKYHDTTQAYNKDTSFKPQQTIQLTLSST